MRGQFAAEEFCIAACHEYPHLASKKAIYEQVPTFHVLNLVQEEIRDIRSVKLINARKDGIQVFRFYSQKTVVIEVYITVTDAMLQQNFVAEGGLPGGTPTPKGCILIFLLFVLQGLAG